MAIESSQTKELYEQYVVGNYGRYPLNIVRGKGSYVWDAEGNKYLDLLPGLGVGGLGHCPPRVVSALQEQIQTILHIHNNYLWDSQARLAEKLAEKAKGISEAKSFFCNSGTEAVECLLKMARLHGKKSGRWKFVVIDNGFHGRSYGALSATAQPVLQKNLGPLVPGFVSAPLNDIDALKTAVDEETCAFLVEPVQGEGGIVPCTKEYLTAAREICNEKGALVLYDEIQSGMGRTGDWFAWQTIDAPPPDAMSLAKALGGGFPIGAVVAQKNLAGALVPGTHGSTFGGNHLACVAALAVLETIEQDDLLNHVRETAKYFGEKLQEIKNQFSEKVKGIRQVGLMVGLELNQPGAGLVDQCRNKGLLINCTQGNVLRFLPAMNVRTGELDEGAQILSGVLQEA